MDYIYIYIYIYMYVYIWTLDINYTSNAHILKNTKNIFPE